MIRKKLLLLSIVLAAWGAACGGQSSDDGSGSQTLGLHEGPIGQTSEALTPDTLEQYSQKCDTATGVTVPDFVCDDGTEVPVTNPHYSGNTMVSCDKPNRLNGVCDPGSHFRVLTNTADAFVVAHCRKKGLGAGRFGDIAVIQYGKKDGSTCFYQALGNLDGNVKAPSKGQSAWSWYSPTQTANIGCARCHDNGPIIRSPYLTQVTGPNKLPGAGDFMFNSTQPYKFVGNDFASWTTYKVEVAGNTCNGCHRMGVNNVGGSSGTSLDFGIRATGPDGTESQKNPHSAASPIWMTPGQITYSQAHADSAAQIKACAQRFHENPLPSSASCKISQFSGTAVQQIPGSWTAVWTPGSAPEIQVYGWTYTDYRAKYDQLWTQGWRLYSLQPYVINGNVVYNAVWRQSNEGEIQVYGWTYADYRAKYDQLWGQGWRLKILQPYVLNGNVYYTAVWKPSTQGEIQVYGWTYADYRAKYDALWNQGWRLEMLKPYVVGSSTYYTAVWTPSTEGEIQVYGWTYADYRARYDALWNQGWRLKLLEPYVVNGQTYYTAAWRPRTGGEIQVYGWSYADYRSKYDQLWDQGWRLEILHTN